MIEWSEQEKVAEDELNNNHKHNYKKKRSNQGILVRVPPRFYKKIKKESELRKIPMSRLLEEKLKQCEWISDKKVLIRKELNII